MVKNNQNFVKKTFLLLKYQKLLVYLVKNLLKKLSYFSRCFYMESPSNDLNQGLSKHQEVCFTPVTKVEKFIVIFGHLFGAI